jgi:hypothetical protein
LMFFLVAAGNQRRVESARDRTRSVSSAHRLGTCHSCRPTHGPISAIGTRTHRPSWRRCYRYCTISSACCACAVAGRARMAVAKTAAVHNSVGHAQRVADAVEPIRLLANMRTPLHSPQRADHRVEVSRPRCAAGIEELQQTMCRNYDAGVPRSGYAHTSNHAGWPYGYTEVRTWRTACQPCVDSVYVFCAMLRRCRMSSEAYYVAKVIDDCVCDSPIAGMGRVPLNLVLHCGRAPAP